MGLSSNQASSHVQHSSEFSLPTPPTKTQEQNHQESTEKLKCPRCDSTNTKFCYYNNYNKSQPRHFCKSCRRYWTEGGTLRNVPVGGGRKNKRPKPPPTAKAATKSFHLEIQPQIPKKRLISLGFGLENENNTAMISLPDQNQISTHDDLELQFSCPSFSDLYGCGNGESSALDASLSLSSWNDQPWTYMESTNSSWVWDDIDKFVTSDVSLPWDDTEIN